MKNMQSLGAVATCVLLALSTSAVSAISFDISFVGGGATAKGVLTADPMLGGGYLVSDGSLTVTADSPSSPSAVSITPYLLVPGANTGAGVGELGFQYDNVISAGYTLDSYGLLFSGNGWLINLYTYVPETYYELDNSYSEFWYGTTTISPAAAPSGGSAVPDGGLTVGLLGGALLGLGALRRKLQA